MLKRGLHRLVRVYTCQNATSLKITCHGSFFVAGQAKCSKKDANTTLVRVQDGQVRYDRTSVTTATTRCHSRRLRQSMPTDSLISD